MTHRSTFCSPWRSLNTVEYFHLRGSSEFQFSNSHLDKIVQFCSRSSTLARIVCFDTFLGSSSTLIRLCFQYTYVSKLKWCFQYPEYVSKRFFMFPISFFCFQYPMYVSNIHFMFPNANDVSKLQCFQSMFPIYMEPSTAVHGRPARFGWRSLI